jgi:hypothetical protein
VSADDTTFAAWLTKATAALGTVPAIWSNLDQADGALATINSGQSVSQVVASGVRTVATVVGKALVTPDSGQATTASYTVIQLGRTITRVRGIVVFGAGTDDGASALILTRTFNAADATYITNDGAVHPVLTNTKLDVGFYQNGSLDPLVSSITLPTPLAKDGVTAYQWGYDLDLTNNQGTFYVPYMAPIRLTSSRFADLAGGILTVESYWATGQCQSKWLGFEAN